jgi:hypothetical protein
MKEAWGTAVEAAGKVKTKAHNTVDQVVRKVDAALAESAAAQKIKIEEENAKKFKASVEAIPKRNETTIKAEENTPSPGDGENAIETFTNEMLTKFEKPGKKIITRPLVPK